MSDSRIKIPGYEILEQIGEGGMGTVYKARQLSLDRLVAIKTLPKEFARKPEYIQNFQREARIEATLKHPNIVQVYEAGHVEDTYFFIMEHVSGESMVNRLERKGRLPEGDALAIAEFIARALEYAWAKARIVHGDIKPGNIMTDEDGTIKLGDFLALTVAGGRGEKSAFSSHILGTLNYMPPEQLLGSEDMDCRADIYSLGAVLYHMLGGKLPFRGVSEDDFEEALTTSFLEDVQLVAPDVSTPSAWLVEKLMVRDVAGRPSSWTDVLDDLQRVRGGFLPNEPLPTPGSSVMRRSPGRSEPVRLKKATVQFVPQKDSLSGAKAAMPKPPGGAQPATPPANHRLSFTVAAVVLSLAMLGLAAVFLMPAGQDEDPFLTGAPPPLLPDTPERVSRLPRREVPRQPALKPPRPEVEEPPEFIVDEQPPPPVTEEEVVVAPPVKPEPLSEEERVALALQTPERAEGLRAYTILVYRVSQLLEARSYDLAAQTLDKWLSQYPGHPFSREAKEQRTRIAMARAVPAFLVSGRTELRGMTIDAGAGRSGVLTDIEDGKIRLMKPLQEHQAFIELELATLPDETILQMLDLIDTPAAARNKIVWQLASGQSDAAQTLLTEAQAAGADVATLAAWRKDGRQAELNSGAYKAIRECMELVRANRMTEARSQLEWAQIDHAESDVFRWAQPPELATLREALDKAEAEAEVAAASPAAENSNGEFDFAESTRPRDTEPSTMDFVAPLANAVIPEYGVRQISRLLVKLDGQTVKLVFTQRARVTEVSEGHYRTQLSGNGGVVTVEFDESAFSWVKQLRQTRGKDPESVYARVDGVRTSLVLLGRERGMAADGTARFTW